MRRSLSLLLEHDRGLSLVAEAPDLRSAVAQVLKEQPDVLVLDLGMPDGSSLRAIGDLRRRAPGTQIVALSMNDDPSFARGALTAGALGFVLKQLADEELPDGGPRRGARIAIRQPARRRATGRSARAARRRRATRPRSRCARLRPASA